MHRSLARSAPFDDSSFFTFLLPRVLESDSGDDVVAEALLLQTVVVVPFEEVDFLLCSGFTAFRSEKKNNVR